MAGELIVSQPLASAREVFSLAIRTSQKTIKAALRGLRAELTQEEQSKLAENMPALVEPAKDMLAQDEPMGEPVELPAFQPTVLLKEVPPKVEVPRETLEGQPKEELPQELATTMVALPMEPEVVPPDKEVPLDVVPLNEEVPLEEEEEQPELGLLQGSSIRQGCSGGSILS